MEGRKTTNQTEGAEKIIEVLASNNVEIPEDLQELAKGYGTWSP